MYSMSTLPRCSVRLSSSWLPSWLCPLELRFGTCQASVVKSVVGVGRDLVRQPRGSMITMIVI